MWKHSDCFNRIWISKSRTWNALPFVGKMQASKNQRWNAKYMWVEDSHSSWSRAHWVVQLSCSWSENLGSVNGYTSIAQGNCSLDMFVQLVPKSERCFKLDSWCDWKLEPTASYRKIGIRISCQGIVDSQIIAVDLESRLVPSMYLNEEQ